MKNQLRKELQFLNLCQIDDKKKYISEHSNYFLVLSQLIISLKLIYPTTVKCESGFSLMKNVKTDHRTKLSEGSLDSIMRIKYSTESSIRRVVNKLVNKKSSK